MGTSPTGRYGDLFLTFSTHEEVLGRIPEGHDPRTAPWTQRFSCFVPIADGEPSWTMNPQHGPLRAGSSQKSLIQNSRCTAKSSSLTHMMHGVLLISVLLRQDSTLTTVNLMKFCVGKADIWCPTLSPREIVPKLLCRPPP